MCFPSFRSRGAIRELGKVLGLPPGEIERAATLLGLLSSVVMVVGNALSGVAP